MVKKLRVKPIDDLGFKILEEIGKDPRQSLRKISKKVGAAPSTIKERLNRFEQDGMIKGYSAIVDYDRLGYITAVIQIIISHGKLLDVEKKIATMPEVLEVYDVSGNVDAIVIAKFKDRKELSNFVKKLSSMHYVQRTITHLVLNVIK